MRKAVVAAIVVNQVTGNILEIYYDFSLIAVTWLF
jgi:hypothetical protein